MVKELGDCVDDIDNGIKDGKALPETIFNSGDYFICNGKISWVSFEDFLKHFSKRR